MLPAPDNATVRIHPVVFHKALDLLDAAGWQVRQEAEVLRVLVAAPGTGFDPAGTERELRSALAAVGAIPPRVQVSVVDAIAVGPSGKRPLVVALPGLTPRSV